MEVMEVFTSPQDQQDIEERGANGIGILAQGYYVIVSWRFQTSFINIIARNERLENENLLNTFVADSEIEYHGEYNYVYVAIYNVNISENVGIIGKGFLQTS